MLLGSGVPVVVDATTASTLSKAKRSILVSVRLLNRPEKLPRPSPSKPPDGTELLNVDVPAAAPFSNALSVRVPPPPAVAKSREMLDKLLENEMDRSPDWPVTQKS